MYLRYQNSDFSDPIVKDIESLMDHAEIYIGKTKYDSKVKELCLYLKRFPVIKKSTFARKGTTNIHAKMHAKNFN